jgi:hypothetical protein
MIAGQGMRARPKKITKIGQLPQHGSSHNFFISDPALHTVCFHQGLPAACFRKFCTTRGPWRQGLCSVIFSGRTRMPWLYGHLMNNPG